MDRTGKMAASSCGFPRPASYGPRNNSYTMYNPKVARQDTRAGRSALMFDNYQRSCSGYSRTCAAKASSPRKTWREPARDPHGAPGSRRNFKVVKQLLENIKQKAMGEEVLNALSPSQQVVKIVHEELIKILGSHESKLRYATSPQRIHDRRAAGLRQDHLHGQAGRGCRRTATRPWWFRWTSTVRPRGNN